MARGTRQRHPWAGLWACWLLLGVAVGAPAPEASAAAVPGLLPLGPDAREAVSEALMQSIFSVLSDGVPAATDLREALRNSTWANEHSAELAASVQKLQEGWASVDNLWQAWNRDHQRSDTDFHVDPELFRKFAQPLLEAGLVIGAVVTVMGKVPFDLFSRDVHSRTEIALTFTIASLVSLTLANTWRLETMANNPFALYVSQLVMSFLGVASTLPVVIGGNRNVSKVWIFVSIAFALGLGGLWLTSASSIIVPEEATTKGKKEQEEASTTAIVLALLVGALMVIACRKAAFALGVQRCVARPFFERHERDCSDYVRLRLRRHSPDVEPPSHAPSALLVATFGVGALMTITLVSLSRWGFENSGKFRIWVLRYMAPMQPIFDWAGTPLPLDEVDFMLGRAMFCSQLALAIVGVYVAWIMRRAHTGYRSIFAALMRAEPYKGRCLVEESGPGLFHSKWGTYFAGALIGNCMMGFVTIGGLVFVLALFLSLPEFWAVVWTGKDYYILYGLLYVTRWCIFRWVIPRYVVSNDGAVIRRRVWALLFPTLTLLNFIVGATSGVFRFLVMFPYMLVHFFRVDTTFLPDHLVEWDWSYQPFLSLVLHAHTRLNPSVCALAKELEGAVLAKRDLAERQQSSPTCLEGEVEEGADAGADVEAREAAALRRRQARGRWYLAVTLLRNPSLRSLRGHVLAAQPSSGAPASPSGQTLELYERAVSTASVEETRRLRLRDTRQYGSVLRVPLMASVNPTM